MHENAPAHPPGSFVYDPKNYWRYHPDEDDQYHGRICVPESNTIVIVSADTLDELNAIRALIAAAPDLLAAAKRAEAALAIHGASNCEAAKECRAAIAKVLGK